MATSALPVVPLQAANAWSAAFVTVLAIAFLIGIAFLITINRYNRPDMDASHAAYILAQLRTFGGGGTRVVIRSVEDITDADVLADLRGLFSGEVTGELTVRGAVGVSVRQAREEISDRKPDVPSVPVRAVQEAVLTALFGSLAVIPVAAWRNAARSGGGTVPTVPELIAAGQMVVDVSVAVLTAFPYTDVLFAFALTFGIVGAETAWSLWMAPPLALVALAGAYVYLERRVDVDADLNADGEPGADLHRVRIREWSRRVVALAALTWGVGVALGAVASVIPGGPIIGGVIGVFAAAVAAGVVVYVTRDGPRAAPAAVRGGSGDPLRHVRGANWKQAVLFGALGLGIGHPALALAAAVVFAFALSWYWTRDTFRRWAWAVTHHGRDAFALSVVHSLTVAAAALTLPLLIGYVVAAVATGKALAVARVVVRAPEGTALAVGLLVAVASVGAFVVAVRRSRAVRRGVRRALSVQAVRTALFTRALPFALIFVAMVMLLGLGAPPVLSIVVALTLGVLARLGYMALNWATYRYKTREGRDKGASRVVVNGRQVTDADGEPVYVASVNGHRTAHRRLDPLIGQIQRDARKLLRDGEPEAGSFPRYFYVNGVKRGKVDVESVGDELRGDIRTRLKANVVQTDADASEILETLRENYPDSAVDTMVRTLKDRGKLTRREDRFEWHGG